MRDPDQVMAALRSPTPDAHQLLHGLVGETIPTLAQGRRNRILRIEGDRVFVGTQKSPTGKPVPIAEIQDALDRLFRDGEIEISVSSVGHRSAFIGAVLGTLDNVEIETRPRRVRLKD